MAFSLILFLILAPAAGLRAEISASPVVSSLTIVEIKSVESDGQTGGDDFAIFRFNIIDNPETSARSLVRILVKLDKKDADVFIQDQLNRIAEMMYRLNESVDDDREIIGWLAPFGIVPLRGVHRRDNKTADSGQGTGVGGQEPPRHVAGPLHKVMEIRRDINEGKKQEVEKKIETLVQEYPKNSSVHTAAAEYYNEMQNFALAERSATSAIELNPKNADAYKTRAVARVNLEDRNGAINDIKKAMEIDPQDESSKILSALIESKRKIPSLKNLSSAQEVKKFFEGPAYDEEGAVVGGQAMPGIAPAVQPGENGIDYAKSNIYLKTAASKIKLGDYESAVKYASLAVEKNPENIDAYLERANANNYLGKYDDAVRDATLALESNPSNLNALNIRSWALNKKGLFKEAETNATKAINLNPNFADAWFIRGLAREKMGSYDRMLEDFKQAALLNSTYGRKFNDAVAQYSHKAANFNYPAKIVGNSPQDKGARQESSKPNGLKRFLVLLIFTIAGGVLIALGFLHIFSSSMMSVRAGRKGKDTQPDILAPSVFYEGVASGKYRIEKKLGEGGMGVVYEAVDQSLDRKTAIKKMNEEIKINDGEKQRFLQEARTVAMLHHPNIVEIYTIFEEDGNIYLVFEYVDGQSLERLLNKEIRMPLYKAKGVFDGITKALSYAHSKNIVHRDLKLSNIMISADGFVKVMDFGLARHAKDSAARSACGTDSGQCRPVPTARFSSKEVIGSPAYMAPEQEVGIFYKQSDVFSLGVCLYEVLTGDLPFKGPDYHYQKANKIYYPVSSMVDGISEEVDAVIDKALDPDLDKRYKKVEEFRFALMKIT
ncbi:MAG: protein kinase [Elusimicrobia bacterium]|nr:protein kinase [Elusimicrobiota bacterium]